MSAIAASKEKTVLRLLTCVSLGLHLTIPYVI